MFIYRHGFRETRDKEVILKILRLYLQGNGCFLATLKDKNRNIIYEGVRPLSITTDCTEKEAVHIALTNADVHYQLSIGSVDLDDIEYIQETLGYQVDLEVHESKKEPPNYKER